MSKNQTTDAAVDSGQRIALHPDAASIPLAAEFIEKQAECLGLPMRLEHKLQIAVDEIYSNIVYYSKAGTAAITCRDGGGEVTLIFEDDGLPYDPTKTDPPDVTLPAEERQIGGLGIFMVKKLASSVAYERRGGKNVLELIFRE